jgi:hypothetical protein
MKLGENIILTNKGSSTFDIIKTMRTNINEYALGTSQGLYFGTF